MKFPPMVFHTVHPNFEAWRLGATVGDLHARLGTLRRQEEDPDVREDGEEYAVVFWSLKHVEMELERREKTAERRDLPPDPLNVTLAW